MPRSRQQDGGKAVVAAVEAGVRGKKQRDQMKRSVKRMPALMPIWSKKTRN